MKLININIEGNKHFDTVIPFIEREAPDVLCLQEVLETDLHHFKSLGYTCLFDPAIMKLEADGWHSEGSAICTPHRISNTQVLYYQNESSPIKNFIQEERLSSIASKRLGILVTDITYNDTVYTIGTTHFTWTPQGEVPTEQQRESMQKFLELVKTLPSHVIAGDFNIPRHHNPLYRELAHFYTDTIPESYHSSLDASIHYAGKNPELKHIFEAFMVDYVLTLPPYSAKNVRLEFGISDHAAVVATIERE